MLLGQALQFGQFSLSMILFNSDEPMPSAAEPAARNDSIVSRLTPPVGMMRRCVSGASSALM